MVLVGKIIVMIMRRMKVMVKTMKMMMVIKSKYYMSS